MIVRARRRGPDGTVEYLWSSAAEPPPVRSTTGAVVLDPPGRRRPGSVPVEDVWVDGPGGRIHALVQKPAGRRARSRPSSTSTAAPTWHDSDAFAAGPAAWVDHGFAVVRVNYRGSTGYGRAWTDALKHRVGLIELEDIAAVRDWAVASGLADPDAAGPHRRLLGRLPTLLGLGTQPDAWALGLAAVPVADYVTAYHDEMEALKAMDRTLLGGTPGGGPGALRGVLPAHLRRRRSARRSTSRPAMNDPRCPIRQIDNYVERLARARRGRTRCTGTTRGTARSSSRSGSSRCALEHRLRPPPAQHVLIFPGGGRRLRPPPGLQDRRPGSPSTGRQ